jgi:hypothetical protein
MFGLTEADSSCKFDPRIGEALVSNS